MAIKPVIKKAKKNLLKSFLSFSVHHFYLEQMNTYKNIDLNINWFSKEDIDRNIKWLKK